MTRKWPCCGTTYTHSDTVGCCSACGRVFSGLKAFDAHQVGPRTEHGRLTCLNPWTAMRYDTEGKPRHPIFEPTARSDRDANGGKDLWAIWQSPEAHQANKDRVSRLGVSAT